MDRPDGCHGNNPALLTRSFYHIECQRLDNMSHLCVIWGSTQQPWSNHVDTEQDPPPLPTCNPNVLTEKVLMVPASSPSQPNLALRRVRRSSSSRGGFTNTTYGMNSSECTRFSFCRGGGGRRRKRRKEEEEEAP